MTPKLKLHIEKKGVLTQFDITRIKHAIVMAANLDVLADMVTNGIFTQGLKIGRSGSHVWISQQDNIRIAIIK